MRKLGKERILINAVCQIATKTRAKQQFLIIRKIRKKNISYKKFLKFYLIYTMEH